MEDGLGWRYASFNAILYYSINSHHRHHPHFSLYFPSLSAFSRSLGRYICFFLLCTVCTLRCSCAAKIKMSYTIFFFSISPAHTHIKCSCSFSISIFIPHTYTLVKKFPTPTHTHIQHESSHTDKKVSNSNKKIFLFCLSSADVFYTSFFFQI